MLTKKKNKKDADRAYIEEGEEKRLKLIETTTEIVYSIISMSIKDEKRKWKRTIVKDCLMYTCEEFPGIRIIKEKGEPVKIICDEEKYFVHGRQEKALISILNSAS